MKNFEFQELWIYPGYIFVDLNVYLKNSSLMLTSLTFNFCGNE